MRKKLVAAAASLAMLFSCACALPQSAFTNIAPASITAEAATAVKLDKSAFSSFSATNYGFAVYGNDKNNGVYTVNDSKLFFISAAGAVSQVYDFKKSSSDSITNSYLCGSKLYLLGNHYESSKGYVYRVFTFDLDSKKLLKTLDVAISANAVAADSKGNIFLADPSKIYLLNSSGTKLSEVETGENRVYRFAGYDETSGNLYFEGYLNYIYWGYDHDTNSVFAANVKNNKLTFTSKSIDSLFQKYFYDHNNGCELIGGKYLAYSCRFMSSKVGFIDSNTFDLTASSAPYILGVARSEIESDKSGRDNYSCGIRTLYNSDSDSFIIYTGANNITEFDKKGAQNVSYTTKNHVFSLSKAGSNVFAIELDDDGNYYLETINWKRSTTLSITSSASSVAVGKTLKLTPKSNGGLNEGFSWSSSDTKVATVSQDGKVYATGKGTVTITVSTSTGLKATKKLTVTDNSALVSPVTEVASKGASSTNASRNDYTVWSKVNNSYICEDSSKNIWRAEYIGGKIIAEKYSAGAASLLKSYTVTPELSLFGGVYFSTDYNYVVTGQKNASYSDSAEVLRVTRYTKDWKKKDHVSVKGANTFIPFDAGSCRFTEIGGKIYIHTCHTMYADSDGLNHQANMTYILDKATMKITDSQYSVDNLTSGYVSHSFDQFVLNDGKYVYRVDHAEGQKWEMNNRPLSTEGITITRMKNGDSLTNVAVTVPLETNGTSNYTGIALGGAELSKESCLIGYVKDLNTSSAVRDVYLSVTDKLFNKTSHVKLTGFTASSKVRAGTPHIVKVSDYLFAVMWEEKDASNKYTVKMQLVDGMGNKCSAVGSLKARLSDCQPIMCSDGCIRWYVTASGAPKFYAVQPFEITDLHTHNYVVKSSVAATCTTDGSTTKTCSVCGKTVTETIKAKGHSWNSPTYTWSSDMKTCTAKRVCKNDKSHTQTEKVTVTSKVKTAATCAVKGTTTYTAAFKNTAFKTQTKDIQDIALTAHKWSSWARAGFDIAKGTRLESRTCSVCKKTETRSYANSFVRIFGAGRYDTAVQISKKAYPDGTGTVVLAYGLNYADALAGVPLAQKLKAPILLTDTKTIDKSTLAEIKRLGAKKVVILGGEGAIGNEVVAALVNNGIKAENIERIAGNTRFGTATAIAKQLNAKPTEVFFVYGLNYADALSVSTVAAVKGAPIIYLTTNGELDSDTKAYLEELKAKKCVKNAYVIGGDGVISDDMMNKAAKALGIKSAVRIFGADRFATCTAVNQKFASVLTGDMICAATGMDFPDALAGGVYAAKNKAPLFLINSKAAKPDLNAAQLKYLKAKKPNKITVFGGTGAVSDAYAAQIAKNSY